jgi:type IV pilus assembly protein PilV
MQLRSKQTGMSLVEVMVATLVLALGMAGVAALMVANVTSTNSAQLYSQANIRADQMADIMRANLIAYEAAVFTADPGASTVDCVTGTTCTMTEQAQYDYAQWRALVAQELPAGQGFICTDSTPDDGQPGTPACDGTGHNVIKVFWRDTKHTEGLASDAEFRRFAVAVVP